MWIPRAFPSSIIRAGCLCCVEGGASLQPGSYFLAKEAYRSLEVLLRYHAPHVGLHDNPRQTQDVPQLAKAAGHHLRCPIHHAVLQHFLVRDALHTLGPLVALRTTVVVRRPEVILA